MQPMNYIVVGCGRIGADLAYRLFKRDHRVTVIDHDETAFKNLPPDFVGRTIDGEALNASTLHRAGIETAHGIAVVTSSDSLNAVIAHIARLNYHIENVVVRNYDPAYRPLHQAFQFQIVSSTTWGAQRMEEMLYHGELRSVFSAGNGEVEIYEIAVPEKLAGRKLGDLLGPTECVAVGLTRAGHALLPGKETTLQVNDLILMSATFEGVRSTRERIQKCLEE